MKSSIKKTLAVAALALGSSVFAANSNAALVDLNGSASTGSLGANVTGSDLSAPGNITINTPFFGAGTGDYSLVPGFTGISFAGALNLGTIASWDFTSSIGSFIVSQLVVETQNANFLNVYTRGIFTPNNSSAVGTQALGCNTAGNTCNATDTSLRWSFTKSGASYSASGTFNSPAVPSTNVPEPTSLSLMGLGLAGLAASRRRKANKAA